MNPRKKIYDWVVVGGGISGIVVAEILVREGKNVLLLEKNNKLVSETSKEFHEWMHSGSLYSLLPSNVMTMRYLLGATDDILEYYQGFPRMNMIPTESGINISESGWFNDQFIEYRYRIRKFNPVWLGLISRSVNIIDLIKNQDWLRRRAGSEIGNSKIKYLYWLNKIQSIIKCNSIFFPKLSTDFTMNSRLLISDILNSALQKGLHIITNETVTKIVEEDVNVRIDTDSNQYFSANSVVCSPDLIAKQMRLPIKISYAPIAIVENISENENNFVELDYYPKKCINLIKKGNGIGQAGGITVEGREKIEPYLNYVINEHKKRNPRLEVIDSYVGLKKELVQKGENRNYLYHIHQNSSKVWSIILGKFSLAFSLAPEFFRRVYKKNPTKIVDSLLNYETNSYLSETSWKEIVRKNR